MNTNIIREIFISAFQCTFKQKRSQQIYYVHRQQIIVFHVTFFKKLTMNNIHIALQFHIEHQTEFLFTLLRPSFLRDCFCFSFHECFDRDMWTSRGFYQNIRFVVWILTKWLPRPTTTQGAVISVNLSRLILKNLPQFLNEKAKLQDLQITLQYVGCYVECYCRGKFFGINLLYLSHYSSNNPLELTSELLNLAM